MKKFISVVLVFAMMLSITAFAADIFSDVPFDYWGVDYITEMYERQVVNGYPEGDFKPENNVTRAEFAKMLAVISGAKLADNAETSFTDVPKDEWYTKYVAAVKNDFVTDNISFRPEEDATREDVAAAIAKEMKQAFEASNLPEFNNVFSDSDDVSYMIAEDVADAYALGIIEGYPDGTFKPTSTITRAEVCTMLSRAFPKKEDGTSSGSGKKDGKDKDDEEFIEDFYIYTLSTDKTEYSAGEEVVFSVKLNTLSHYVGSEILVQFDSNFFEIEEENNNYVDEEWLGEYYDIPAGSFPGVLFPESNAEKGRISVMNIRLNATEVAEEYVLNDVEIIRIRFKVKDGVSGDTKISLSKCKATNGTDTTRGSIAANDATITIK